MTVLHPSCACKGKSWPAWGGAVQLTAAGVPESHTVCPDPAWNRGRSQKHEHLSLFQQGTPKAASREKGPLRAEAAPGLRLDASGGPAQCQTASGPGRALPSEPGLWGSSKAPVRVRVRDVGEQGRRLPFLAPIPLSLLSPLCQQHPQLPDLGWELSLSFV